MNTQKGSAHVIIILILVIALIGTLGFVFWQNYMGKGSTENVTKPVASSTKSEVKVDSTPETKTYTNKTWGFSLSYPSNWVLEEKTEQPVVGTLASSTNLHDSSPDSSLADVTIQALPKTGYKTGSTSGAVLAINGNAAEYASMKYNETINSIDVTEYDMYAQSPYFAVLFPIGENYIELDFNKVETKADMTSELQKIMHSLKAINLIAKYFYIAAPCLAT